jgi:hypothetical protein
MYFSSAEILLAAFVVCSLHIVTSYCCPAFLSHDRYLVNDVQQSWGAALLLLTRSKPWSQTGWEALPCVKAALGSGIADRRGFAFAVC